MSFTTYFEDYEILNIGKASGRFGDDKPKKTKSNKKCVIAAHQSKAWYAKPLIQLYVSKVLPLSLWERLIKS